MKNILSALLLCCCLGTTACTGMPDMKTAKKSAAAEDYETAIYHYESLSEFGLPEAKVELAKLYANGAAGQKDSVKALNLLKQAEAEGSTPQIKRQIIQTQVKLSSDTLKGKSIGISKQDALQILSSAAHDNNPQALFELGYAYEKGYGVEINGSRSANYYQQAAAQDYPRAYAQLGRLYARGLGVPKSPEKAEEYFKIAQNKGINVDNDLLRLRQNSTR